MFMNYGIIGAQISGLLVSGIQGTDALPSFRRYRAAIASMKLKESLPRVSGQASSGIPSANRAL